MLEEKSGPEKATNHFSLVTNHRISSARFYWENKFSVYNAVNVAIPAAVSVFPGENYQAELDRAGVSQTHLLQQARQRRPFRGVGTASDYGLVAAVVSADLVRAQRIADRLHSGVVHVNDQTVVHGVYGPIGGVGDSGNGFGHGTVSNADQFSEWQWITTRSQLPAYPF